MSKIDDLYLKIKNNKNIKYKQFNIVVSKNEMLPFVISKDVSKKYYISNKIIYFAMYNYLNNNKLSFKTNKNMDVDEVKLKFSNNIYFISYSKSTRTKHIDHRIRINEAFNTLSTGKGCSNQSSYNYIMDHKGIRILTPEECEQLQGYPINYTKYGIIDDQQIVNTDTQRYKMCGNGISSPVSKTLIESFITEPVNVFSTFSGCGGSELLLDEKFNIIGHCEFDKIASGVLKKHHQNIKNYGDITKINYDELPNFDLLIGGFPCQPWSISGLKNGFDDKRGQLIYDIFKIIKIKKPKYFVLENVKNLISHNKGLSFEAILEGLSNCGYEIDFRIVDSHDFGLNQHRHRVYIFGKLM